MSLHEKKSHGEQQVRKSEEHATYSCISRHIIPEIIILEQ